MEFGIGMFGDVNYDFDTGEYQSSAERLKEIIEEAKLADKLGIDVFAMGEHHRADYAVPAPEIILAALSTVTKNIILSSGVNVISSSDPVKLYQDFSMIDLLSGGRTEIMAGRGSFIESFPLFGYKLEDYNELFEEKLELLLEIQKNKVVNWEGKFRAPLNDVTIYPRLDKQIPISIAVGGTPTSVVRAGRLGLPIIFAIIGGNPVRFKSLIDYYRENYIKYGHNPAEMRVGVHMHTFIGESEEEILEKYYPRYARAMNKIGKERGWTSTYTMSAFKAGMGPYGPLFMGTSEQVTEKLINTLKILDVNRFIAHVDVGGPTHEMMMKNIDLLGSKVMPEVKKELKSL